MWTGTPNDSTPLQFAGTVTYQFADINKNMVVWTKTEGAATIYDMLDKTGPIEEDGWADLYEKVRFCIEQGGGTWTARFTASPPRTAPSSCRAVSGRT